MTALPHHKPKLFLPSLLKLGDWHRPISITRVSQQNPMLIDAAKYDEMRIAKKYDGYDDGAYFNKVLELKSPVANPLVTTTVYKALHVKH